MSNRSNEEFIQFNRRIITQLRMHKSVRVKRNIEIEADYNIDFNEMIYRVEKMVAAEKLAEDYYTGYREVHWPETTWQMFKHTNRDSWWLGWFVSRHPVQWHSQDVAVSIKVERYLIYPDVEIPDPALGPRYIFERIQEIYDDAAE